jgi:hypothetical protein
MPFNAALEAQQIFATHYVNLADMLLRALIVYCIR